MGRSFVPAAGHDFFLPFYDPLWWLLGGSRTIDAFIRDAELGAGQRVLDVGCGTGNLAIRLAQTVPGVHVTALDPDPKALRRAARKAVSAGLDVEWEEGFGDALPHDDDVFDRVVSSFMFHHLDEETKRGMLREIRRVLRPAGQLHLIDFDRHGGLAAQLDDAGLGSPMEISRSRNWIGPYAHYRVEVQVVGPR